MLLVTSHRIVTFKSIISRGAVDRRVVMSSEKIASIVQLLQGRAGRALAESGKVEGGICFEATARPASAAQHLARKQGRRIQPRYCSAAAIAPTHTSKSILLQNARPLIRLLRRYILLHIVFDISNKYDISLSRKEVNPQNRKSSCYGSNLCMVVNGKMVVVRLLDLAQ